MGLQGRNRLPHGSAWIAEGLIFSNRFNKIERIANYSMYAQEAGLAKSRPLVDVAPSSLVDGYPSPYIYGGHDQQ